jgi:hypothetical protein
MELRARYAVVKVNGVPTPFIISPRDSDWSRPLGSTNPSVRSVFGAGWVRWTLGADMQVVCEGQGMFFTEGNPVYRPSRGHEDAVLLAELLSKPLKYVVFHFPERGADIPVFMAAHQDHFSGAVSYQHSMRKYLRAGGEVNFRASESMPDCYGEALIAPTDVGRYTPHLHKSAGVHDAELILEHYR